MVLAVETAAREDPIIRQQLKWLRNGDVLRLPSVCVLLRHSRISSAGVRAVCMQLAVLSLPLIPLTLAYAIARYRLMDVDIIFRRGFAYTLATVCVLAGFYGDRVLARQLRAEELQRPRQHRHADRDADHGVPVPADPELDSGTAGQILLPGPYDYRRTLIEFARELNSETDLDEMLTSVGDRVMQTLSIRHVASSWQPIARRSEPAFRAAQVDGIERTRPVGSGAARSQFPQLAARHAVLLL